MVTKEVSKSFYNNPKFPAPSLIGDIRRQVRLNQERGDRKSLNDHKWWSYGVDIESYEDAFSEVLNGSTIYDLIKDRPFPVVVDLMGPSEAIASLFNKFPGKPKLGLAVSLEDLRSPIEKSRDNIRNVEQIAGDILKSSTWDEIRERLAGRKADLIMERALSGFRCIPSDPSIFALLLRRAWKLLSRENGVLMVQIPLELNSEARAWIESIRNDIKLDAWGMPEWFAYLKMVKTPDSPEKLPFLK